MNLVFRRHAKLGIDWMKLSLVQDRFRVGLALIWEKDCADVNHDNPLTCSQEYLD